jgi:predicted acetyltransferase
MVEIRPAEESDLDRVVEIVGQAFNAAPRDRDRTRSAAAGPLRVAEEKGKVLGALRVLSPWGHFLGGRPVAAAGIAGVAVAPEARGRRMAETMVVESLREFRDAGAVLTTLHPATVPLYRRCGYEYAGLRAHYRASLDAMPRGGELEAEPWHDADLGEIASCYAEFAAGQEGLVDRPEAWWGHQILNPTADRDLYRYLVREDGRVTGYVVYEQETAGRGTFGYHVSCRDLVWTTGRAVQSLQGLLASHRSLGRDVGWFGSPTDAMAGLLEEQEARVDWTFRFMARLLDVPGAFEARGYREHVRAAVELSVRDPHFGGGAWRIEVADGTAKVAPLAQAAATTDIGTLSAMYTGYLSPADARRLGRLHADGEVVDGMESMLGGRTPWVFELF